MINVGTKLKSVKNGNIVEVVKKSAESCVVRTADGTEKSLSASTVARWYDEVADSADTQVKASPKKIVDVKQKSSKSDSKENAKKTIKKDSAAACVGAELSVQLQEHLKKIGCTIIKQVAYDKIASKGGEILAHIWFLRKKVRIYFKEAKLQDTDKAWMVKLPKSVSTVYTYAVEVADPTLMNRCLALLDRING